MNYTNQPEYTVLPPIPPELRVYFDVIMIVFVIGFFAGVHYRMHVVQHLVPPFYIVWLAERLRHFFGQRR